MYNQSVSIKYWAEEDRPREKLRIKGRQELTDTELLAILLGTGYKRSSAIEIAKSLLLELNNDLQALAKSDFDYLIKTQGLGPAKAAVILSAIELGLRISKTKSQKRKQLTSSQDAFNLLHSKLAYLDHECFYIILLNRNNRVVGINRISQGGVTGTVVDPKIIFRKALSHKATAIILAHNHPSGNLNPSDQDIQITGKLIKAGKHLDIQVLDHLIISEQGYYSFADEGKME